MVFAYRKLSTNGVTLEHNTLTYRKFSKFNRTNFRNGIASQNWDEINNFSNPNDMWSKWKCMFLLSIVGKHAQLRTMRVHARSSPWITSELKKRMHNRNILKIKAIRSKDPFLMIWKCARVAPLFKAGDRNDVNKYRPISMISVVAKVKELSMTNYMPI